MFGQHSKSHVVVPSMSVLSPAPLADFHIFYILFNQLRIIYAPRFKISMFSAFVIFSDKVCRFMAIYGCALLKKFVLYINIPIIFIHNFFKLHILIDDKLGRSSS